MQKTSLVNNINSGRITNYVTYVRMQAAALYDKGTSSMTPFVIFQGTEKEKERY